MNRNEIRVFISSTFVGLEDERKHLMTKVFPKLKREALKRSLTLVPLDLRWGVTKEQAEKGKTVWICLNEINKSKPFFIGILGKRYGWQPPIDILSKDTQLEKSFPTLRNDFKEERSMTEIEIQHAVLRNPDKMDAFFYITTDSHIEKKQKKLIEDIIKDKRYNPKYYSSIQELGKLIEDDFLQLLDTKFPAKSLSDFEEFKGIQYAELIQQTTFFVQRNNLLDLLDSFLNQSTVFTLSLYGPSGCGKSCLVANWIRKRAVSAIYLFVGNTFFDKSPSSIVKYLLYSICEKLNKKIELRKDGNFYYQLVSLFDSIEKDNNEIVIVIDGVDQVIESNTINHSPLSWLPLANKNIKLIVTTNREDQKNVLEKRGAMVKEIPFLGTNQRKEVIKKYLNVYAKNFNEIQVNLLAGDKKSKDAVILTNMLNEMVFDSVFETVDMYINEFVTANDENDFIKKLVKRATTKYNEFDVLTILGEIALSKFGLTRDEILSINLISDLEWSTFYCGYSFLFAENNGLIILNNKLVRKIIIGETETAGIKQKIIRLLVDFFDSRIHVKSFDEPIECKGDKCDIDDSTEIVNNFINSYCESAYLFHGKERSIEELASLYRTDDEYVKLYKLLINPICFIYLQRNHFEDLQDYWSYLIQSNSEYSVTDYSRIPEEDCFSNSFCAEYYYRLAQLSDSNRGFLNTDYTMYYLQKGINYLQYESLITKFVILYPMLIMMHNIAKKREENDFATECSNKAELLNQEFRTAGGEYDSQKLSLILNSQRRFLIQEEKFLAVTDANNASSVEERERTTNTFNELADVFYDLGKFSDSIEFSQKTLNNYETLITINYNKYFNSYVLAIANLAVCYYRTNNLHDAFRLYEEAIDKINKFSRGFNDSKELLASIKIQYASLITDAAELKGDSNYYSKAWEKLKEALIDLEELYKFDPSANRTKFGEAFYATGRLLRRVNQYDMAIDAYERAIELFSDNNERLARCYSAIGAVYHDRDKYEDDEKQSQIALKKSLELYTSLYEQSQKDEYKEKIDILNSIIDK